MLAISTVPSDVLYLRSCSAVDGIGCGVLGGNIEGCGLRRWLGFAKVPVFGVASNLAERGVSGVIVVVFCDIYEASKDTWICANRSRRISGGTSGLLGAPASGFLI